jgi:hypothetical protein
MHMWVGEALRAGACPELQELNIGLITPHLLTP